MSQGPFPVCFARALSPYLDFLYGIGAPVDRWLEQCRLPVCLSEDLYASIPTLHEWRFIALAAQKTGVEDLAPRIAQNTIYQTLGPRVVGGVYSAPTLLCGIEELSRQVKGIYSGMRIWVTPGPKNTVELNLGKSFEPNTPGFTQTEWRGIEFFIKIVRLFAGPAWQPDFVSLRASADPPPLAKNIYSTARFLTKQPRTFISFSKQLMSCSPCGYGAEVVKKLGPPPDSFDQPQPPANFSASLEKILESYIRGGYPSIDMMAEITQMSPRTLQRRLKRESVSFKTLIDRSRFKVASKLLTQTDLSSMEIALDTGYNDPSHFARAFRRIAGCSPREYRKRRVAA